MLLKERLLRFKNRVYRSKHGIWTPDRVVPIKANIIAILRQRGVEDPLLFVGANTVTNDGDIYYAERGTAATPTTDFSNTTAGLRLGSSSAAVAKTDTDVTTFITGANTAVDSTYPKVSDGDADNTGSGTDIASWRYQYAAGAFSAQVKEGAIVDNDGTPTKALTHFTITAFTKTTSDTLKFFVNHQFNGT
jgi:hypothetical protein